LIKRSKRWSFMPGCHLAITRPISQGKGHAGTQSVAVSCPDDFFAIRVGFMCHYGDESFHIPLVKAVTSRGLNDGLNPTGDGPWVTLTAASGGADSDRIVTNPDAPCAIPIPGTTADPATGRADIPRVVWTDWVPLRSAAPDPTGRRWCFIRELIPGDRACSYVMGDYPGLLDDSPGGNGYCFRVANCFLDDYVTASRTAEDMRPMNAEQAAVYRWWPGSQIAIVQLVTARDGVTIMTAGDSHAAGVGSTGDANAAVFQSASGLGAALCGRLPIGIVNAGWPGSTSEHFLAAAAALLPAVQPAVVVLPGWTFNDSDAQGLASAGAVGRFLARVLMFADQCVQHGAVPVFTTPYPRDPGCMAEPSRLQAWRSARQTILGLRESGTLVIDAAAHLSSTDSNGELSATYRPGLSDDTVHPNDQGHGVVADLLRPVLERLIAPRASV
jgi:lysophospholipase L1-like esterase